MPDYDLSLVEAVIVDTQSNTLRLLRDVLARVGVKKVELYDNYTAAQYLLTAGQPDLLLLDCDGPHEAEAFRFVRTFRNDPGTPNPFAAIIVTSWQATQMQVMRMTNSGVDDMLVKPMSPKQVQDRIAVLIEARKRFVVTSDYMGPDRRKSPRDGAQVPLLDVPNTLRLKALGTIAQVNLRQAMTDAKRLVGEQKRLRTAIQLGFLVEFAGPGLVKDPPERMAVEHLARIPAIIDDLHRRLPESGVAASAETSCRAIRVLADRLRTEAEAGAVDSKELAQLRSLTADLMQTVDPNRPLESMMREVQAAVGGYRNRLDAMAQARADAAKPAAPADGAAPAAPSVSG